MRPWRTPGRSRPFRNSAVPAEDPLEGPNPASEFVLRDYEDPEIGRAPLQELTAKLLESNPDRLLVPHESGKRRAR